MREIKFNFWDAEKKQMIYWNSITPIQLGNYFSEKWRYIPLQYTGLKDKKNNKEIYEGDIVECCCQVGKIEWENDSAGFTFVYTEGGGEFGNPLDSVLEEYEILGNIYEGRELINDNINKKK